MLQCTEASWNQFPGLIREYLHLHCSVDLGCSYWLFQSLLPSCGFQPVWGCWPLTFDNDKLFYFTQLLLNGFSFMNTEITQSHSNHSRSAAFFENIDLQPHFHQQPCSVFEVFNPLHSRILTILNFSKWAAAKRLDDWQFLTIRQSAEKQRAWVGYDQHTPRLQGIRPDQLAKGKSLWPVAVRAHEQMEYCGRTVNYLISNNACRLTEGLMA